MSLRNKTLLTVGTTMLLVAVVLYLLAQTILLNSFYTLETQYTRRNVERVLNLLEAYEANLAALAADWAEWDDTYRFIQDRNPAYIQSNLVEGTFTSAQLNLILMIGAEGEIIYGQGFDLRHETAAPLPAGLQPHLAPDSPLVLHSDPEDSVSGLLALPEGILLAASYPILKSSGEGPVRGSLIFGRYLDEKEVAGFEQMVNLSLELQPYQDAGLPQDYRLALAGGSDSSSIVIQPLNEATIGGYTLLEDIYGRPAVALRIDAPRYIYQQGKISVAYFMGSLLALAVVVGLVIWLFLERQVLSRLAALTDTVFKIGVSGDLSRRVALKGSDELARLAASVDGMLDSLETARKALQESEEKFRKLAESSSAVVFILKDGKLRYINPIAEKIFEYSRQELQNIDPEKVFTPESLQAVRGYFAALVQEGGAPAGLEFEIRTHSGAKRYLELTASTIEYQGEGALIGTAYDITRRKTIEEQLLYLSVHDALSGLYNRTFFEEEMKRIEQGRLYPVSIVMADIDGLKVTNDSLGHAAGDELIRRTAAMIKKTFRSEDIIARIGGDEFAVLLPGLGEIEAQRALERFGAEVTRQREKKNGFALEISAGVATCRKGESLAEAMKRADEAMYQQKQLKQKTNSKSPGTGLLW